MQRFAKSDSSPQEVPQIVHEVLHSPGQPLDSATRAFMESGLSHEFSNVRLSSVAPARARNHFAVGEPNDIYEQEAEQVADSLMRKKGSQNNDAENPRLYSRLRQQQADWRLYASIALRVQKSAVLASISGRFSARRDA